MQSVKMSRCILKLLKTQKKAINKLLLATETERKLELINVVVAISNRIHKITIVNVKDLKAKTTICWVCRSLITDTNVTINVDFNGHKEDVVVCPCCYEANEQLKV